jgi:hypothetical protein
MNRTSRSSSQQTSSYSRASLFKYRPGDQLHRSMHFVNFPNKLQGQYVKLGHILYNSFTTRYVILKAVKANIIVFWDFTPCNFDDDQRFGEHGERETSTVRRSRKHVLPKFWYLPVKIHGVKSRKIVSSALLTNHPIIRLKPTIKGNVIVSVHTMKDTGTWMYRCTNYKPPHWNYVVSFMLLRKERRCPLARRL